MFIKNQNELIHSYYSSISNKDQHWSQILKSTINSYEASFDKLQEAHASSLQDVEERMAATFRVRETSIRKDAIEKAKSITKGFDGETFSPFLIGKWNPRDYKHMGDPIDYLILDGAENVRSGLQEEIDSITLLEIKTGSSDMNTVQRRIRDAVVANRVQFAIYNPDTKITRIWSPSNPKGKDNELGQSTVTEPSTL